MIVTQIVGRVVVAPQWVATKDGGQMVKLLVSCQTDVKGDNGYYITNLFSCWFYGKLAKMVAERVTKGMMVCVAGRSKIATWTDKQGEYRAGITITAFAFDFVRQEDKKDIGAETATPTAGDIVY